MKAIEPARTFGAIRDETGILQQAEMARHCRAADGQLIRKLLDGPVADAQQLDDGAPVGVAERLEWVPRQ